MGNESQIIRTEIIRVLNENGKTRASELVRRIAKKVGDEKMIYREISSLVESGEIEKKVYSKSHIEYELVNLSESANNQLKNLHNQLEDANSELEMFHKELEESKIEFQQRVRTTIQFIHVIQSIESIMKFLSYYPTFKKDKMFSQIDRKLKDCWDNIMQIIAHQPEEEFLNEIISNIRVAQIKTEYLN